MRILKPQDKEAFNSGPSPGLPYLAVLQADSQTVSLRLQRTLQCGRKKGCLHTITLAGTLQDRLENPNICCALTPGNKK